MSRRLVTALGTSIVLAVPIIAAAPVAGANEEPYFTVAISEGKCLLSLNQANPQAKQNQQFLASPTKNRIQYFNSRIPGLEALVNELADAHTSEKTALAGGENVGMTKSGDALTATKSKITELVTRSGMNEKDAEEIIKLANDYRKEGGPTQVSYEVEQKKITAALTAATVAGRGVRLGEGRLVVLGVLGALVGRGRGVRTRRKSYGPEAYPRSVTFFGATATEPPTR